MTEKDSVAVLGAGGHAKVVIGTLQAAGDLVAAVFDDDAGRRGLALLGAPVVGRVDSVISNGFRRAIVAVGDNRTRRELAEAQDLDWVIAVHPRAWVHPSVHLGEGTVVFAGAMIQPDTTIGHHVIINTGASIDHDCQIGDYVHIAPGAHIAGGVTVGEGALLGIGCSVIPGVSIGAWATIGAGAAVIKDVPDRATVRGVPAR